MADYIDHLQELPADAPWDEKPGESQVEQYDTDQIPERDITEEDLRDSGDNPENWLLVGNNYEGHRQTAADAITPENADQLELEYTVELGLPESDFQGSPLIVDGDPPVMYQTVGPDMLFALNARTGDVLWEHVYENADGASEENPPAERGPGLLGETVYKSTLDHGVLAVNRYTGEEEWYYNGAAAYRGEAADDVRHEELQWERSRGTTSCFPPMIYDGLLLKGSFGGEYGVSGFFDAINVEDGTPEWRVNMTPTQEWVGNSWQHGGGTAWASANLDPDSGTIVVPSANPGPWYGTVRPGYNPYTCGKVAIDIETGEHEWHFQDSPHDWWDWDSSSPALVFEEEVDGESTTFATWAGKTGWAYTVNMETGQLHQRSEEIVQHHNMWALPPYDDLDAAPWMLPAPFGGSNASPSAFDPESRTLIVKGSNLPSKFSWYEVEYDAEEPYFTGMDVNVRVEPAGAATADESDDDGARPEDPAEEEAPTQDDVPEWNQQAGVIAGLDPLTGEIKWKHWYDWEGPSPWGGSVTIPTGVTLTGDRDGLLLALDTETGDRLAAYDIGVPGADSSLVSWYDPTEEKQYVAVGGTGGYIGFWGERPGNRLAVYSLQA